jgi:hypothetical protein
MEISSKSDAPRGACAGGAAGKVTNSGEADRYLNREYWKRWDLETI